MESLPTRFRKEVFEPYLDLLHAEFRIHPAFDFIREVWERDLSMDRLVNGPFLERAQLYAAGDDLGTLDLHPDTLRAIETKLQGRNLYKHQTDALRLVISQQQNVAIATGTSSGKTLCFQVPILDALLRDPSPGLRAVIVYPMNALVNDQLEEWEGLLAPHPQLTFAKFTGQTPIDQRDYEERLRKSICKRIQNSEAGFSDDSPELQRRVERELREKLEEDARTPNHLRHRTDIRSKRPQVLITNFSMLEYLLVRPVDAPIFVDAKLQFLVLDEAHAYRGVQATEIGYLLRRLKHRLGNPSTVRCIATSATLGDPKDAASRAKVREFAQQLFDSPFGNETLIFGTLAVPSLSEPAISPAPDDYISAAELLRGNPDIAVSEIIRRLDSNGRSKSLGELLCRDQNLHRLRTKVLDAPKLARDAACELWPNTAEATVQDALHALLDLAAEAKRDRALEDLLPTRLHYFVKAQQGLHLCLRRDCPERVRQHGRPTVFLSRKTDDETPEGQCPHCHHAGHPSRLIEIVSCRKCGYLYGALQDLGPRFRQNPERATSPQEERFDNFDTALGWAADSFWSFFSVEDDLPYPTQSRPDEDEEDPLDDLIANPKRIDFCTCCGKKVEKGEPHPCASGAKRELLIFHRQCPAHDQANLDLGIKRPLTCCPNCGARNNSGVELVRRFQESEDETGLAMAPPLAYFQVGLGGSRNISVNPKKLLTFTDHRQRAAAFPSLLEEETFTHDLGRKIVALLRGRDESWTFEELGRELACIADPGCGHPAHTPQFFLPVSRLPQEPEKRRANEPANLAAWQAEVFAYFGVPDSARESAEDIGLAAVEYEVSTNIRRSFSDLFSAGLLRDGDLEAALQTLFGYMRQARAFTLPSRVPTDAPAFGRVGTDIYFARQVEGRRNTRGWLPRIKKDGSYAHNRITDYLTRLTDLDADATLRLVERIWELFTSRDALKRSPDDKWQLFHDQFRVRRPSERQVCDRCGIVTAWSALGRCPRKGCAGHLQPQKFEPPNENAIARWVAGADARHFASLRSEEHTAQIDKDLAREIEESFRANGVNLLSSTTTFELGINIGDLQKVLLRNAPPTPASYVQRVGRTGRGNDKNSVCVTLCRGTKYDLDMWQLPESLMSGRMRAPTVFLKNRIIAQRHFNAVAFAAFLRHLDTQGLLCERKQHIRLEGFLPLEAREELPPAWRKLTPPNTYFDFSAWLRGREATELFHLAQDSPPVTVLGGIAAAIENALDGDKGYRALMTRLSAELEDLLAEYEEHYQAGRPNEGVEVARSIQNLLSGGSEGDIIGFLAKNGFLPRYAFPLDVVSLETRRSRWLDDSEVDLSRDRGIAIAEFAPGAQIVARKRVFVSGGLYIASSEDRPQREYFSQCPRCRQIRSARIKGELSSKCEVCGENIGEINKRAFIEPHAFSIRFDGRRQRDTARFTKSTLIRQRPSLTHFIDAVPATRFDQASPLFRLALLEHGKLFRYNLGPSNKGFLLCPDCGWSAPKHGARHAHHTALRGRGDLARQCHRTNLLGANGPSGIAFAHEFESYCLVIRPVLPVGSIQSVAYALQKGACRCLELDSSDLGVSWRSTDSGTGKEVVLYDRTPGGAGFVAEARDRWTEVEAAARIVCDCPAHCEVACYDCLKDYGNQPYHEALDRHQAEGFFAHAPDALGHLPILETI